MSVRREPAIKQRLELGHECVQLSDEFRHRICRTIFGLHRLGCGPRSLARASRSCTCDGASAPFNGGARVAAIASRCRARRLGFDPVGDLRKHAERESLLPPRVAVFEAPVPRTCGSDFEIQLAAVENSLRLALGLGVLDLDNRESVGLERHFAWVRRLETKKPAFLRVFLRNFRTSLDFRKLVSGSRDGLEFNFYMFDISTKRMMRFAFVSLSVYP